MNPVVAFYFQGHTHYGRNLNRVAVTYAERYAVPSLLYPIPNSHQFHRLAVSLGDASDGVGNQTAGQSMQRTVEFAFGHPFHQTLAIRNSNFNFGMIDLG